MGHLVVRILFYSASLVSWFLMIFGIPGNWLMAGISCLYFFTAREYMALPFFLTIMGAAIVGELLENFLSLMGAKTYGAGKKGMAGAFFGSIAGGFLGSMIAPVTGTIIGVLAGAFLLTYGIEYWNEGKSHGEAVRSARGAMIGKAAAISLKYAWGIVILVCLFLAFF